ncbi:MAG: transcriptional regulator [Opitutus sp.]|nr:transcriptional regulator [Opitutus sp.]
MRARIENELLTLQLQASGPLGARALLRALDISQPTLSRRIAALGESVETIGNARSRRYALRRNVRQQGHSWPIHRIQPDGSVENWGRLTALHGGFRFVSERADWLEREYPDRLYPGLPFFLQDVGPQGYLGRAIAREAAAVLNVPPDVRNWNDDDVLSYLLLQGKDLAGDLVVGERMLEQALRGAADARVYKESEREAHYPAAASAAQRGEQVGSSAGGEQPKFVSQVRRRNGTIAPVMVKFSVADVSPVQQRWMDLLLCEHLAAETIAEAGFTAVRTAVLDAGGRRFLEIERFDRVALRGRRGIVTLGALEDALVDAMSAHWTEAAQLLERAEWIERGTARELRWLGCFGDLIANNDMHRSNASFWLDDPPFRLTPAYDMLPMLFAPGSQGEITEREFRPRPPLPTVADVWPSAAAAADRFWQRVQEDARLSDSFRALARRCQGELARWR